MNHLTEQELILRYYGEDGDSTGHLATCAVCQAEYRAIAAMLDAMKEEPVPVRGPEFEALLWQRLAPELKPRRQWWRRSWLIAPALAAALFAAFFAGRFTSKPAAQPVQQAGNAQGRERILLVALGDHLERSQMVLVEIANARPADGSAFHLAQERARDLVDENRLYRQTALLSGDSGFLDLLDDLERVLTDVTHSPSDISLSQLEQIQRRIESRGLIFKIRVMDANLQAKGVNKL
jgi:hypothetical protein